MFDPAPTQTELDQQETNTFLALPKEGVAKKSRREICSLDFLLWPLKIWLL